MSRTLPERPSLEFLKKSAKQRLRVLRAGDPRAQLADAQFALAREYGFASWRKLKAHVEAVGPAVVVGSEASAAKVVEFLEAALVPVKGDHRSGTLDRAEAVLREEPGIATANLLAACVLGDAKTVGQLLTDDPKLARRPGGPRDWPPLLYLCYSRYLRLRKEHEMGFVRAAKALVEHGADPNSLYVHEGFNETALYGAAGIANAPRLTRFLLEAGADPDDKEEPGRGAESLYHSCEHPDNECLRLILAAGPRRDNITHCLGRKLDFEDIEGAGLMIDFGADPNRGALLHAVRRGRGAPIVELLIERGADVNRADASGMTAIRLARRLGNTSVAECLLRNGAAEVMDAREEFLAACAVGNIRTAKRVLRSEPGLVQRLTGEEMRVLPDAAAAGRVAAVRHMLDLGFDIDAKGDWGGPAVQQAAGIGHVGLVRLLIRRGADLGLKNDYGGDALGAAIFWARQGGRSIGSMGAVAMVARASAAEAVARCLKYAEGEGNAELVEVLRKAARRR